MQRVQTVEKSCAAGWVDGELGDSVFRAEADVPLSISDSEVAAAGRGCSLADCVSLASVRLCFPSI